jgi:hypothetical protein
MKWGVERVAGFINFVFRRSAVLVLPRLARRPISKKRENFTTFNQTQEYMR